MNAAEMDRLHRGPFRLPEVSGIWHPEDVKVIPMRAEAAVVMHDSPGLGMWTPENGRIAVLLTRPLNVRDHNLAVRNRLHGLRETPADVRETLNALYTLDDHLPPDREAVVEVHDPDPRFNGSRFTVRVRRLGDDREGHPGMKGAA